jgi:hypothetical protein
MYRRERRHCQIAEIAATKITPTELSTLIKETEGKLNFVRRPFLALFFVTKGKKIAKEKNRTWEL